MFQKRRSSLLLMSISLCMAAVFTFAGGCGGGSPISPEKGSPSALTKKKTGPAPASDTKAEKKEEAAEYAYNPSGKPDPFKPFIQLTGGREYARNVPLTPLQKYDISQLKLVAVIINSQENIALVEDSSGKGYFLKKGTSVGKNEGKVIRILKDRVIVQEVSEDIPGQKKVNEVPLILNRLEEGGES